MAMTKAETARMEALERGIKMAKAMRWPDFNMPASMTKADIDSAKVDGGMRYGSPDRVALGWFANAYDRGQVSYGCSNGTNHNSCGNVTSTQGMGRMYVAEVDAWRAIRVEMTERFAAVLARIDDEISRCEASPHSSTHRDSPTASSPGGSAPSQRLPE